MATLDRIALLTELCSIPTAPFCEARVIDYIDALVRKHRTIKSTRDKWGNTLLIRSGKQSDKHPRLVFVAHLDHPGFVAREMLDERTVLADFHGGVLASFVQRSKANFFDGNRVIPGKVIATTASSEGRCETATLRVSARVSANSAGMFDVGTGRVKGGKFHCRVCDDLAGVAAALAMLIELDAKSLHGDVGVLLTRAEEVGFVGALGSVIHPQLLKKTDRLVSVETSAEQPVAKQGNGVVLRIGDKTSIFHSAFSRFIHSVADDLALADKSFRYQRALMPGGTCEGTVFDGWGYIAAALCVPLGNYHNMDKLHAKIAAENVHLGDWHTMIRLFDALAKQIHTFDGTHSALKKRLTERFEKFRPLLNVKATKVAGA